MQLPLVFNAIERYEKRYGFVHVLLINRYHYECVKLTMSMNNPELWSGLFHWRKAYQSIS